MAEDLFDCLENQNIAIDAIKRVIINYKKLSKSRLADLQKHWKKIWSLHARINRTATAEDGKKLPYFLQDEFLAAEDAYNEAADYLQEAICRSVIPKSPACDPSTDTRCCDGTKSSSLTLSRISLLIFSGKLSEWQKFRHTFQSLVHSNKTMTDIAKFHYLTSSVKRQRRDDTW